ncbi:hypothetical protein GH714_011259 [Hevea brasiliensis]|uniref:Myb-like domain-containing protein n=1 Tax=Hevea brasiliensis TaxID=3981 RepID=A0A6A6MMT4_HEVBR|nr:hypothetical protein GH714_011259 [Hevea brasiliensis]
MGRAPCCSQVGLDRGSWTAREDKLLINYIRAHGEGHWRSLPKKADENVLDEMFEEYEQLRKTDNYAQLDSFIDSLLA